MLTVTTALRKNTDDGCRSVCHLKGTATVTSCKRGTTMSGTHAEVVCAAGERNDSHIMSFYSPRHRQTGEQADTGVYRNPMQGAGELA